MVKKWILAVAAVFIAIILIGEVIAYGGGVSYDSSASRDGDTVSYSVSSSGTNDYTAVLIDNHGFASLKHLVIYVDENSGNNIDDACARGLVFRNDIPYYADQLKKMLELRSFDDVTICDSKGLAEYVNESSADPRSYGILSVSYSLPGEIYTGNADDKLMKWMDAGGSLYWTGSVPGQFYYDAGGEMKNVPNCQELFFGATDCIKTGGYGSPTVNENEFTNSLSLINEYTELGLDITKITSEYRAMGAIDGNYSSATLVKYGEGMMVHFSGGFELVQAEDVAQIVASKICYKSTIIDYEGGRVTRTTERGSFESLDGDVVYVFIGRNYSVYGRAWDV